MDDSSVPAPDIPSGPQEAVTRKRIYPVDVSGVEFAACYHAEMPSLIRYLMNCGASACDAADAAQQAFIDLWASWRMVRNPKSWIRTVAFRKFLKLPVKGELPLEEYHDRPGLLSASRHIELREEDQTVMAFLQRLPMTQRQVFALHYDGFKTSEVAEILQMKEPAVRKNLERARATLKELLEIT